MLRFLGNKLPASDNCDSPCVGRFSEARTTGHCVVELKLGNSGGFEDSLVEKLNGSGDLVMESTSGGSKRSRVSGNGTQAPSCLVDGCTSDLSKCREYHRRHKVCELHSKTPKVFIKGQERRFCQQCSRFHSVAEFDEVKRSCRKRLEGHNRRRRKPQPDSLSISPAASLFPNHQGPRYLEFGSSQLFPAGDLNSSWNGAVKSDNDQTIYSNQSSLNFSGRKNLLSESMSPSYRGGRQLPFLVGDSIFPGDTICEQSLSGSGTLGHSSSSQKVYSDGLNLVIDSNRALSLLSFPSANTQEIGVSHMVHQDMKSPDQSMIHTLNYNNSHGLESEPVGSALVSGGRSSSNSTNIHAQDMFQVEPDGSSASGSNHMLSFSWE